MHTRPYPGIPEALDALRRGRGSRSSRTSRARRPHGSWKASACARFEWVIGGDTPAGRKPDPAGLQSLMRAAAVDARATVMVGDSVDRPAHGAQRGHARVPDALWLRVPGLPTGGSGAKSCSWTLLRNCPRPRPAARLRSRLTPERQLPRGVAEQARAGLPRAPCTRHRDAQDQLLRPDVPAEPGPWRESHGRASIVAPRADDAHREQSPPFRA